MAVKNVQLRSFMAVEGIKVYELAHELGYSHENNLSRALRNELKPEEAEKVMEAAKRIAERKKAIECTGKQ